MKRTRRKVLFQEQLRTPEEVAKITGNDLRVILSRIKQRNERKINNLTDYLSAPLYGSMRYLYAGEYISVSEIVKRCQRSSTFVYDTINTLSRRNKNFGKVDLYSALNDASVRVVKVFEFNGARYSANELSKLVGRSAADLKKIRRAALRGSLYEKGACHVYRDEE